MEEEKKQVNQREVEKKWQDMWKADKVFEMRADEDKPKYFGTVAYPYANSVLHIGHGRTNVTADIFLRFQRLLGKQVLFPMGFHISGTPVLAVADGIKRRDEKQIKITREAVSDYLESEEEIDKTMTSFSEPLNIANFFSSTIEDGFDSVGMGIDWSRKFTTGEPIYNKFIEWQYKKLNDLGILTQGKYPILYSPQAQNAVGEDDIKDGDVEKVTIQEMTYILFESKKRKGEFFAVATLRPDALFGTTNLWIDEEKKVVKVKVGSQVWIVSKEAAIKIEYQFDDVKIISEHLGSEFVGEMVVTPLTGREVVVAKASFLDPLHGTGLAYSSPAGSPHDFMGLSEAKAEGRLEKSVEVINTVETFDKKNQKISYMGSCPAEDKCLKYKVESSNDADKLELAKQELYKEEHYGGKLNSLCGEFEGMFIKDAKDKVKAKLEELNLGGTLLETSRRAKTRSDDNVVVANLDGQWFLDYSDENVKQNAYDLLENMTYLPSRFKETQMGYLKWVSKRPCARKRGLGTPLPYDKEWIIEPLSDSTIYQMLYLITHIIRRENIEPSSLTEELFDYLYLSKGNLEEATSSSKLPVKIVKEMKREVEYWHNNDFRYVGQPHMSNHMSFLIYHYSLIFNTPELKKFHPSIGVVGGMLQRNGEKISKSKGNGIPLSRVGKEFGVDLYRLYIGVGASFDVEMDFRDEEILQLEKKFDRFKELMFDAKNRDKREYDSFNDLDKWLISKFYSKVLSYIDYMNELKIREAYVSILYEFLSDISYHTRRSSQDSTLDVLRFIFADFVKVMTPIVPHICEELYVGEDDVNKYVSLCSISSDFSKFINKQIEEIEGIVENLVASIARMKDSRGLRELKQIRVVQASKNRFLLFDKLKVLLDESRDFKKILGELKQDFGNDMKFIQKFVPKTLGEGLSAYLSFEEEKKLLETVKEFVEVEFGCTMVISSVEDEEGQFSQAVPAKPALILE